jgi:hypothetical protein
MRAQVKLIGDFAGVRRTKVVVVEDLGARSADQLDLIEAASRHQDVLPYKRQGYGVRTIEVLAEDGEVSELDEAGDSYVAGKPPKWMRETPEHGVLKKHGWKPSNKTSSANHQDYTHKDRPGDKIQYVGHGGHWFHQDKDNSPGYNRHHGKGHAELDSYLAGLKESVELDEAKVYHHVLTRGNGDAKWDHYSANDTKDDAQDDAYSQRNQGLRTKIVKSSLHPGHILRQINSPSAKVVEGIEVVEDDGPIDEAAIDHKAYEVTGDVSKFAVHHTGKDGTKTHVGTVVYSDHGGRRAWGAKSHAFGVKGAHREGKDFEFDKFDGRKASDKAHADAVDWVKKQHHHYTFGDMKESVEELDEDDDEKFGRHTFKPNSAGGVDVHYRGKHVGTIVPGNPKDHPKSDRKHYVASLHPSGDPKKVTVQDRIGSMAAAKSKLVDLHKDHIYQSGGDVKESAGRLGGLYARIREARTTK